MFRQKPANKKAVAYLETYLNALKNGIKNPSVEAYKVAKRTPGDLTAMKITKKENGNVIWLAGDKDLGVIALEVLNHRLKKTKKQIHVPIPEFAAIGDTLKTISERLAHITAQTERTLKRAENSFIDVELKSDLFTVDQQRLEIAAAIASAVYKEEPFCDHIMAQYPTPSFKVNASGSGNASIVPLGNNEYAAAKSKCIKCGHEPGLMKESNIDEVINERNNFIVKATDDLMAKLLKRGNDLQFKATVDVSELNSAIKEVMKND